VGPGFALVLYGVPTAIGWCRALITFVGPTSDPARLPPAPGMPKMVRFVLGLLSTVTPLFHANIQNAIIGAPASSRDPAAGLGHRVGARRPHGKAPPPPAPISAPAWGLRQAGGVPAAAPASRLAHFADVAAVLPRGPATPWRLPGSGRG
jgi:hypothetical protein